MGAPDGFEGDWFPMKKGLWVALLGPLGLLFAGNKGIGVAEDGLVLRGFGTKSIPWSEVEAIRPLGMGAAGLLLKPFVVETTRHGTLTLPINQTTDPAGLVEALSAKGYTFDR